MYKTEQTNFSSRLIVRGKRGTRQSRSPGELWTASVAHLGASIANLARNDLQSDLAAFPTAGRASHRRCPIRILFIHEDATVIDGCLQELKKAQFVVSADVVSTLAECMDHLRSGSFDVVVAEYPSPSWKGSQALQLLRQTVQEIPLLFLTTSTGSESIAQLTADGVFDYVEQEH